MLRKQVESLVADHQWEVLALVVLVNFGAAFGVAVFFETEAIVRASVFLCVFVAVCLAEYVVARRWVGSSWPETRWIG
jgi:hypothetical protein